jgi:hypothetical protein
MGVDTTRNYSLATDDEEYFPTPEDMEEEDEDYYEEEDYYDFPENWSEDDEPS